MVDDCNLPNDKITVNYLHWSGHYNYLRNFDPVFLSLHRHLQKSRQRRAKRLARQEKPQFFQCFYISMIGIPTLITSVSIYIPSNTGSSLDCWSWIVDILLNINILSTFKKNDNTRHCKPNSDSQYIVTFHCQCFSTVTSDLSQRLMGKSHQISPSFAWHIGGAFHRDRSEVRTSVLGRTRWHEKKQHGNPGRNVMVMLWWFYWMFHWYLYGDLRVISLNLMVIHRDLTKKKGDVNEMYPQVIKHGLENHLQPRLSSRHCS